MDNLIDILLHTDDALLSIVTQYGAVTYIILFLIIFSETGIVFFPFLPGDALLFSAGVIASTGVLDIYLLTGLLLTAAILGNTSNYFIGRYASKYFLRIKNATFQRYLRQTDKFYEEHGKNAIIISRFLPVVRTYVPFVAGVTKMEALDFTKYNVVGGLLWVGLFVVGGYLLGEIPWAKENFELMILIILVLTVIPFLYKLLQSIFKKQTIS